MPQMTNMGLQARGMMAKLARQEELLNPPFPPYPPPKEDGWGGGGTHDWPQQTNKQTW